MNYSAPALQWSSALVVFFLLASGCNQHPVSVVSTAGSLEVIEVLGESDSEKIDILWMIDNTGTMCRSQAVLRQGIRDFVEILAEVNLDFHIGVTTTHSKESGEFAPEPVAGFGRLQSTPQPIPGFDPACHHPVDERGQPIRTDFSAVRENIELAIQCTEDPSQWETLRDVDDRDLACALDSLFFECSPEEVQPIENLFPDPTTYRAIPLVLRAKDYSDERGAIDIERLAADFGCMSLVGTRGYPYEQGLASVIQSFSPELTGGPLGDPEEFPNAGFLRPDARTSVIFISDENDCSHDGRMVESATGALVELERSACGNHQCWIQENLGEESALIPIDTLRFEMMKNLALSKGKVTEEESTSITSEELERRIAGDIIAASIHGQYRRDFEASPSDCVVGFQVDPSCQSTMGIAWSGHRYAEFVAGFPTFFPDPRRSSDESVDLADMEGLVCSDFLPALRDIARLIPLAGQSCLRDVHACSGPEAACPLNRATGEEGQCLPYPDGSVDAYFCDSGYEVRLVRSPEASDDVFLTTGFCIEDTLGQRDYPNSCVVDPANYVLDPCGSRGFAVNFEEVHPQWFQIIDGLRVEARFVRRSIED